MAAGSYGYVIVGAGSAGCVLAHRLSADPAVALLEAGGPDRVAGDRYTVGIHQTVSERLRLELPHDQAAAAVGAADPLAAWQDPWRFVIINGQAWTRGHRVDYDGWAELGVPGRVHRAAPPPPRRTQRAGRVCAEPSTQHRGLRHRAADGYLRPVRRRPNLTVLPARTPSGFCSTDAVPPAWSTGMEPV
jgi:choline dehydrogenase